MILTSVVCIDNKYNVQCRDYMKRYHVTFDL